MLLSTCNVFACLSGVCSCGFIFFKLFPMFCLGEIYGGLEAFVGLSCGLMLFWLCDSSFMMFCMFDVVFCFCQLL